MKYIYIIIIALFISLMIFGCGIEGKIDDASAKCQDEISKLLEDVEDICLTKEEILELINSINIDESDATCAKEDIQD
tara:strand:- start:905 stop:1138 length:234 start_codon:yes stop_codon:yes gene_type:complete